MANERNERRRPGLPIPRPTQPKIWCEECQGKRCNIAAGKPEDCPMKEQSAALTQE